MSEPREYTVHGMTCDHCVVSVTEEVTEVAGVQGVDVDLASGRLVVRIPHRRHPASGHLVP